MQIRERNEEGISQPEEKKEAARSVCHLGQEKLVREILCKFLLSFYLE